MCRHKMQLEFICIISGFSKFSAESTPNVPLMPVLKKKKKKPMEKYNHPNSEKRD